MLSLNNFSCIPAKHFIEKPFFARVKQKPGFLFPCRKTAEPDHRSQRENKS